jgi:hypothetical protein
MKRYSKVSSAIAIIATTIMIYALFTGVPRKEAQEAQQHADALKSAGAQFGPTDPRGLSLAEMREVSLTFGDGSQERAMVTIGNLEKYIATCKTLFYSAERPKNDPDEPAHQIIMIHVGKPVCGSPNWRAVPGRKMDQEPTEPPTCQWHFDEVWHGRRY